MAKPHKKYAVINRFNVNIGFGSFNKKYIIDENLSTYTRFINVNANYRFFARQIISPEIGIGLMIVDGKNKYNIYYDYPFVYNSFYAKYTDIMPYMQLGFGIQTRRKVAFISNFSFWSLFNVKAFGANASVGIKYGINNNIALSLSPTIDTYSGNVYGKYQFFEKKDNNSSYKLIYDVKGLHKSSSYINLYGLRFGIHF